ncbi:CDP-diacylglycerol--glycerol-3-phosphate 3-phosphatidyltransferase [Desulfovulcanus sp.]
MDKQNNWTISNFLTVVRILITPSFVAAFINKNFYLAWCLFAFAGITDALDGFLARVLKQRTTLGAMLDPLADKVLLVTSFVCLGIKGWLPAWVVILVVSRDLIILGGLALLHFWGVNISRKIRPSLASKLTTMFQILLVFFVLVAKSTSWPVVWLLPKLTFLVVLFTLISGADYVYKGLNYFFQNDGD